MVKLHHLFLTTVVIFQAGFFITSLSALRLAKPVAQCESDSKHCDLLSCYENAVSLWHTGKDYISEISKDMYYYLSHNTPGGTLAARQIQVKQRAYSEYSASMNSLPALEKAPWKLYSTHLERYKCEEFEIPLEAIVDDDRRNVIPRGNHFATPECGATGSVDSFFSITGNLIPPFVSLDENFKGLPIAALGKLSPIDSENLILFFPEYGYSARQILSAIIGGQDLDVRNIYLGGTKEALGLVDSVISAQKRMEKELRLGLNEGVIPDSPLLFNMKLENLVNLHCSSELSSENLVQRVEFIMEQVGETDNSIYEQLNKAFAKRSPRLSMYIGEKNPLTEENLEEWGVEKKNDYFLQKISDRVFSLTLYAEYSKLFSRDVLENFDSENRKEDRVNLTVEFPTVEVFENLKIDSVHNALLKDICEVSENRIVENLSESCEFAQNNPILY
mmetsp:Transcript_12132/g.34204  ORF Transcript_12132/g.34204 Transcript_12132/m.34204 type:complete len:447 (-) Transcript_12132:65-1405(-)|eukprot:CAMPEP_0119129378 /NCGR_PEP_ID=MMETSP1310-20130426/7146_1 /TAXON_ID=464262 /ORGANISM="Genus nov. species nov., Strain RCC2339" /LENGTH=446 /DNA_ID=CAMNT_0007119797 /DNA_START=64 /DNA_END=1404 /DNA_ORIENTATION=-